MRGATVRCGGGGGGEKVMDPHLGRWQRQRERERGVSGWRSNLPARWWTLLLTSYIISRRQRLWTPVDIIWVRWPFFSFQVSHTYIAKLTQWKAASVTAQERHMWLFDNLSPMEASIKLQREGITDFFPYKSRRAFQECSLIAWTGSQLSKLIQSAGSVLPWKHFFNKQHPCLAN